MKLPSLGMCCLLVCSLLMDATTGLPQAQSYLRNNTFTNWESPHVHPMDMTPDGTKLLAVNTANNSLEIFSVSSNETAPVFLASVPVGLDPVTVRARTNTEAWVVNVISDSVSIVDLAHGIVTRTLQADDEPADVVFAGASENLALVSCAQVKTLLVFSATAQGAPINRVPINGEQPRAMAVSANGRYVYLANFESGNQTTQVVGGRNDFPIELDLVRDTGGPYGDIDPPPNSGSTFSPAINTSLPTPPPVSMIVKRSVVNGTVKWLDDNSHDWSPFISGSLAQNGSAGARVAGWDLPDRDVAIIDTSNNEAVTYQSGLGNILMAIAVNPASGNVTVVGTDATNQIRFEPNVQSTFVHVQAATFTPGGANTLTDLNPHLTYQTRSIPVAQRQLSIGDPRGIVWNAAGSLAYITGMGSNNVVVMSSTGAREGLINVGQGPTGIVLQESEGRGFVLNKFDATISTFSIGSLTQTAVTPLLYDPTPPAIKTGRPMLYNTQINSGLGQAACASCHVDARTDRLAWDLGDPQNTMVTNAEGISFHPMKGPFLTMTLVDKMQSPFLHWRGDRPELEDFEGAFQTLDGADQAATEAQITQLRNFLSTVSIPPDPYRNLDNSFSTSVQMPGPNNTVYVTGNAALGAEEFEANCRSCHVGETNRGATFVTNQFGVDQYRNSPNWLNFYKRIGLWYDSPAGSNSGFGMMQDGTFDSTQNQTRDANMYAFMMSVNGGYPYEPAGLNSTNWSNNTHAAVGKQVTLSPSNPADTTGLLPLLQSLAGQGAIGLVAKGAPVGSPVRGYMYLGNNLWQSDHLAEVDSSAALGAAVAAGATLTFTAVPTESAVRIGIDMDGDGILDADDPNPAEPNATVTNLALNGTATGTAAYDTNHEPSAAIDGNTLGYFDQNAMYVSVDGSTNDWWQVDLGTSAQISLIQLFNRWDCCGNRLSNISVFLSQTPFVSTDPVATRNQAGVKEYFLSGQAGLVPQIPMNTQARYVRVQQNNTTNALQLAEVRVMGYAIGSFTNPGKQTSHAASTVALPLTFTNTSGNTYTFSAQNLPPGLTINSSTGEISGTLTAAAGSSYVVTVTANGPGNPATSFIWSIASTADYSVTTGSASVSIAPGAGLAEPVTVVPTTGFQGSVTLSATGLPSGISSSFYPSNPTTGATNLVLYVNPGTPVGTYPAVITGVDGSAQASTTLNLTILNTQTINFPAVGSQSTGATVTLGATATSGLPVTYTGSTGSVCTVSGNTVTLAAAGTCTVAASQAGSATYAAAASVTQSFSVSTPKFTLSTASSALPIIPNTGGTLGVTVNPAAGFNGNVNFSISALPPGVTFAFSPTSSTTGTTLAIFVPQATPSGDYNMTITGTSGALSASTNFVLSVP